MLGIVANNRAEGRPESIESRWKTTLKLPEQFKQARWVCLRQTTPDV